MIALMSVIALLYAVLVYYIYTMRKAIDSGKISEVVAPFKIINILVKSIFVLSVLVVIISMFRKEKKTHCKPLTVIGVLLAILMLLFELQVENSLRIAESSPVPISFIELKFRMLESVAYISSGLFIILLGFVSVARSRESAIKGKIEKLVSSIFPERS
jgi:hypothetical protein